MYVCLSMTIPQLHQLYIHCQQKICTDTRKLIPNSIFFALKGQHFDGNQYAIEALQAGCKYAVVDDASIASKHNNCILVGDVLHTLQSLAQYHREWLGIPVIAITGSNGKTTTKELVSAVLSRKYNIKSTPGNLNNHIGVPLTILQITKAHQLAVIEMGANHPGEISELCRIAKPNYAIITSIGKEHLEGFGNIDNVIKTNGELYEYVWHNQGKIFIHLNNTNLMNLISHITQHDTYQLFHNPRLMLYTDDSHSCCYDAFANPLIIGKYIDSHNDIFVHFRWIVLDSKNFAQTKTSYFHSLFEDSIEVKTNLLAYHNFINALCAVCVGYFFQVDEKDINAAIEEYIPDKNRMQFLRTSKNVVILDAYNANPTSMMAALEFFKQKKLNEKTISIPAHQENSEDNSSSLNKVLILGDMFELGEHAQKEHISIVDWIHKHFQDGEVFLIGKEFESAIQVAGRPANVQTFSSTKEFINQYLSKNTIIGKFVLIKASRGMQLESIVNYL